MNVRVPPLSPASADRLEAVLADAVDAIESSGADPSQALAKSAQDHGLPLAHLPLAVRALNNGRSARQMFASSDPWVRAEPFKLAQVTEAARYLSNTVAPESRDEDDRDGDYVLPPSAPEPPRPDLSLLAQALSGVEAPPVPARPPEPKVASAPDRHAVATAAVLAGRVLAEMAVVAGASSPGVYAGAKVLAHRVAPEAAKFAFARLDERFPESAAATPHPGTPPDHPLVELTAVLARCRGLTKTAIDPVARLKDTTTLTLRRPANALLAGAAATGTELGRLGRSFQNDVDPQAITSSHPTVPPTASTQTIPTTGSTPSPGALLPGSDLPSGLATKTKAPTSPGTESNPPSASKIEEVKLAAGPTTPAPSKGTGFFGQLNRPGLSQLWGSSVLGKGMGLYSGAKEHLKIDPAALKASVKPETKLPREFDILGQQETINALLSDPTLRTTDPAQIVSTYQGLSELAPSIMKNPTVAGDFVRRTIQTGPLSYLDLGHLVKMEKDYVAAQRRTHGDEEE